MQVEVKDKTGKTVETLTLDKGVFEVAPNDSLLAQYVHVYQSNQRQGTSKTKNRGEVSGSGVKPWRQKGTGRARHGSKRSPLWRTGGVTHGPTPKSWSITLPKKVRRLALKIAISQKAKDKNITVLDQLELKTPKTAELEKILATLNAETRKTLFVLDKIDQNVIKSAANIDWVKTAQVSNLSAYDLLLAKKVIFLRAAVESLQQKYADK